MTPPADGRAPKADAPRRCRLYLITLPDFDPEAFRPRVEAAFAGGDVAALQLRLKGVGDDAIRRAAGVLAPVCVAADVALVMNDRPDLAAELGCDGVHIGRDDAGYDEARHAVGPDAIVGVTCKDSRHLAIEAAEAGADYVAFGAFFQSTTKPPLVWARPEILAWWSETTNVPCVAIGGITVDNCAPLVASGADFLAVASGVWDHAEGPAAAVSAFNAIFDAAVAD